MPWWWRPCRRGSRAAPGRPARGCPGETARGSWTRAATPPSTRAGSRPSDPPDPCSLKSGDRVMAEEVESVCFKHFRCRCKIFKNVVEWVHICQNIWCLPSCCRMFKLSSYLKVKCSVDQWLVWPTTRIITNGFEYILIDQMAEDLNNIIKLGSISIIQTCFGVDFSLVSFWVRFLELG